MPPLGEATAGLEGGVSGGLEGVGDGMSAEVATVVATTPAANLAGQLASLPTEDAISDLAGIEESDVIGVEPPDTPVEIPGAGAKTVDTNTVVQAAETPVESASPNAPKYPGVEVVGTDENGRPILKRTVGTDGAGLDLDVLAQERKKRGVPPGVVTDGSQLDSTESQAQDPTTGSVDSDPKVPKPTKDPFDVSVSREQAQENAVNKLKNGDTLSAIKQKRVNTRIANLEAEENPSDAQKQELSDLRGRTMSPEAIRSADEIISPEADPDQNIPSTTESESQAPQTPEDTQKRIDELAERIKDKNNPATSEELQEFKDLRNKSSEQERLKTLEAMDPKDMTDEQLDEMTELQNKSKESSEPELTPEQQAEKRDKEIEDLSTEAIQKLAEGKDLTPEEEDRLQELIAQKKIEEAGFTPEQARATAKEALKRQKEKSEKGSKRTQEAKDAIQELMSMELQLISQRNLAKKLSEERKKAIEEAKRLHNEAEKAKPEERMKKKGIEYNQYMIVANYSGQIEGTRYTAQRIDARRKDLEQQVRRKLGITGGLGALVEWAGAQINKAITEIAIIAEEQVPFGMGAGFGEHQRGQLASSGRM